MYRVSEASSSGTGVVSVAVEGSVTGCCSGCGGAADMMKAVDAQRRHNGRSLRESGYEMLPPYFRP